MILPGALVTWESQARGRLIAHRGCVIAVVRSGQSPWACVPPQFRGVICFRGCIRAECSYLVLVQVDKGKLRLYWPRKLKEIADVTC